LERFQRLHQHGQSGPFFRNYPLKKKMDSPPSPASLVPGAAPKRKTFKRVFNRLLGRTLKHSEPGGFLEVKDKVLAMEAELDRTLNMMKTSQLLLKHVSTVLTLGNTSADKEILAR
jgi:hypothetical protein